MSYAIKTIIAIVLIHIASLRISERLTERLNLTKKMFAFSKYLYAFIPFVRWVIAFMMLYTAFEVSDSKYDEVIQEIKDKINGE